MITLGINAAFHDSAAALVIDGVTVAAAEEERFSRIKHAKRPLPFTAWELPFNAIDFCLARAGITLAELDHVAYSFDPREFLGGKVESRNADAARDAGEGADSADAVQEIGLARAAPIGRVIADRTGADIKAAIDAAVDPGAQPRESWENPWDALFAAYIVNAPRQLVDGAPHHLQQRFVMADRAAPPYRWHFVNHHACHQASAFLAAPFDGCAVMTLDGRGERATTTYGTYSQAGGYRSLGEVTMPHSLGLLYEQVTTHLGFLHSSDEYKVMALAALGTPSYRAALRDHVHIGAEGNYTIDRLDMTALFGPPRSRGSAMLQRHFDLAASLQAVLEESVLKIARWLRAASGEANLAMAGGVALNCVMNSKLRDAGIFDRVWIQPAAGDAGTALGAALWVDGHERRTQASEPASGHTVPVAALAEVGSGSNQPATASGRQTTGFAEAANDGSSVHFGPRAWHMDHVYLGPDYSDEVIEAALSWAKLPYKRHASTDELAAATARLLERNCIIGWFQGRMEFGPRSLGARSLIASPIDPEMQARLNDLKDREDFRPVAPAVPHEDLPDWFAPAGANGGESPFMLFVYDVAPGQAARIPSACHTDRTARVQTVHAETNPRFHAVLEAFGALTGVPVLVNTSFNVRGEPIVCTPRDAIEAFYSTPLDALVIGSFIVEKT